MKHIAKIFIIFVLVLTMTGCGANESSHNPDNNRNSVDEVINEQMESFETDSVDTSSDGQDTQDGSVPVKSGSAVVPQETDGQVADGVDYDLTTMSSDMVYATVYQMMVDPDTYMGKTFRMDGLYYASYYEPTAQYYHYCFLASNFPHFHRYDSLKSALYIHAVSKNINTFPKNQGRIRAAIAVKILDFTVMYR